MANQNRWIRNVGFAFLGAIFLVYRTLWVPDIAYTGVESAGSRSKVLKDHKIVPQMSVKLSEVIRAPARNLEWSSSWTALQLHDYPSNVSAAPGAYKSCVRFKWIYIIGDS